MKKKGKQPTGMLVHAAKATGFSSVSDMLNGKETESCPTTSVKDINSLPQNTYSSKTVVASPSKHGKKIYVGKSGSSLHEKTHMEEHVAASPMKIGKENIFAGKSGSILQVNSLIAKNAAECRQKIHVASIDADASLAQGIDVSPAICGLKNLMKIHDAGLDTGISSPQGIDVSPTIHAFKNSLKTHDAGISLPQGTDVTSVAGIDIPAEDVGHALQFLEFCKAFGQFFHLSKSHPESILQELSRGCGRRCRTQYSSVVQFQIQLLSLLLKDTKQGENSWLQALEKCISESKFTFDGLPSNCFNKDGIGYAMLDFSQKLRLLNFLCDEALCTRDLRTFIDEQNSIVIEKEKEARQMVLACGGRHTVALTGPTHFIDTANPASFRHVPATYNRSRRRCSNRFDIEVGFLSFNWEQ